MKRLTPWLWLGLRMTLGAGRAAIVRSLLLAAAAAVGCTLMLGALAVPGVVEAQELRQALRHPVVSDEPPAPGVRSLRGMEIYDAIGDRPLLRVVLAGTDPAFPLPPGVARLPEPGEVIVSPELAAQIASDPLVKKRFPQSIVGHVEPSGLVAPDELVAYVGATDSDLPQGAYISGFGTDASRAAGGQLGAALGRSPIEQLLTPGVVVTFAFALFMLAPLGVMLGICSRLAARVRDQRLASLRLLGATRQQAQLANAVEMGLVTAVGTVIGYTLFEGLAAGSQGWSIGRFQWYAADLHISLSAAIAIGVALVVFAVLVSSLGIASSVTHPLHLRRNGAAKAVGWWRLPLFGVTALMLVAAALAPQPVGFLHLVLFAAGVVGGAALLPVVLPVLMRLLAVPLARMSRAPLWITLVAQRIRHSPGVAPRLVATLVVSFFVAGAGMLAASGYVLGNDPSRDAETIARYELDGAPASFIATLRAQPGVMSVGSYERHLGHDGDEIVNVLFGDCANLNALFTSVEGCVDGTLMRVQGTAVPSGTVLTVTDLNTGQPRPDITVPSAEVVLGAPRYNETADIVVAIPAVDATVVFQARPVGSETLFAAISGAGPASRITGPRHINEGFDTGAVLTLVAAGLLVAIGMGMSGFTVAAIDRSVESRRHNASLLVIGAPRRLLIAAEAAQSLASLLIGLLLAAGLLVLTAWSWTSLTGANFRDLLAPAMPSIVAAGAGVLWCTPVVAIAAVMSSRLRLHLLRRD